MIAAKENNVRHPYIEAGIDKPTIRRLAREHGLGSLADLPAAPCLSSRVETGIAIRADVLRSIHAVETFVTNTMCVRTVRCRVRASGIVLELDVESLDAINSAQELQIRQEVSRVFDGVLNTVELSFAAYRNGGAFLGVPRATE
jgi:uncharacterized protein